MTAHRTKHTSERWRWTEKKHWKNCALVRARNGDSYRKNETDKKKLAKSEWSILGVFAFIYEIWAFFDRVQRNYKFHSERATYGLRSFFWIHSKQRQRLFLPFLGSFSVWARDIHIFFSYRCSINGSYNATRLAHIIRMFAQFHENFCSQF